MGFEESAAAGYRVGTSGYRTDIATYNIACTFAMEGRTDEALTWLERAVDTGQVTAHQLLGDEDLESLRDDERFEALLERLPEDEPVHLKHKWKMKEKEATLF